MVYCMSNDYIVCPSCNTENKPQSEFCINCGISLDKNDVGTEVKLTDEEKRVKDFRDWKRSVPYTISAAIFIIFIDLVTGGTAFDWSYWAVVPILLFAVLSPYLSFKMGS